jgi:hypothetical protein
MFLSIVRPAVSRLGHRTSGFQSCLLHHLDQSLSGFGRVPHFSQECNAGASHAIARFHTQMKPKAINCDHGCFLRFNASKFPGKEGERILSGWCSYAE